MTEYAPPSYDDVVSSPTVGPDSIQPSAPPQDEIGPPEPIVHPRDGHTSPSTDTTDYAAAQRRKSSTRTQQSVKLENVIERYISYSVARHLRKYILPKTEQQDPELDVEAHFARHVVRSTQMAIEKKGRLQCISGWLWCIGVIQVLLYIALPIAMIAVGIVGIGDCPFRNNTLVAYLIGGGILLAILVTIRTLPSLMTCVKNRNYFSTGNSNAWGGCICAFETIFYIFLVLNFIALILGTYTTFAEGKPQACADMSTPNQECCDGFVYVSIATFTVFQYVLYAFSGLFVCLVLSCIRSMDKQN